MNDAACTVFINLINLAVRMMPIFVCLEPKHSYRAVSYTHLDVYKRQVDVLYEKGPHSSSSGLSGDRFLLRRISALTLAPSTRGRKGLVM